MQQQHEMKLITRRMASTADTDKRPREPRPRADVPPAILGLAGALHPGAALQPERSRAGWASAAGLSRQRGSPVFAVIVFVYGGMPFLQMAVPELRNRQPGMMTLISLAISVAFVYSLAALFLPGSTTFFWELVTLIDIMLLGHWIEMRSVRQASGALERTGQADAGHRRAHRRGRQQRKSRSSKLQNGDLVLVRPGASVPADGEVQEGRVGRQRGHDHRRIEAGRQRRRATKSSPARSTATAACGCESRPPATRPPWQGSCAWWSRRSRASPTRRSWPTRPPAGCFTWPWAWQPSRQWPGPSQSGFNVDVIARVATVLVIACPHALGLAVPLVVAITTAHGRAERHPGARPPGAGEAREINIDRLRQDRHADRRRVRRGGHATADGWDEAEALALAAAIEGDSEHTIARGIRESGARTPAVHAGRVSDFEAIKGRGVRAELRGQQRLRRRPAPAGNAGD